MIVIVVFPLRREPAKMAFLNDTCFYFCLSLRLGIKEDEEDMRLEEEEMKRRLAMKSKQKKI